jgi:TPR repeat protein
MACTQGDAIHCDTVGTAYQDGLGTGKDIQEAVFFFRLACGRKETAGCINLAMIAEENDEPSEALKNLTEACDEGTSEACFMAARVFRKSADPAGQATHVMYATRSCKLGFPLGCQWAARSSRDGRGTRQDFAAAAALLELGCVKDSGVTCEELAGVLERGDGVPRNPTRALELLEQWCTDELTYTCGRLAERYRDGIGVKVDRARAALLFERECSVDTHACMSAALLFLEVGQRSHGLDLLKRSCSYEVPKACEMLDQLKVPRMANRSR